MSDRANDRARREGLVPLALGIAVVSISFAAIFFRLAAPTHPIVVAGTRLALAALVLSVPTLRALVQGRLPARTVLFGLLCGVLYGVHFGAWVTSLSMTSVASSVTLVTATPLLLGILALLTRRDRPERRHWLSIGLATVGVTLIGWSDLSLSSAALVGDALALLGALAMALYLLVVRGLGRTSGGADLDVLAFSGLATFGGAVSLACVALLTDVPWAFASTESLVYIALAALIPQLVGHNLLMWSLRHATPTAVGVATVGEPVGATWLAWMWLGDEVAPLVGIGCAITLGAVLLSVRRPPPPPE